MNIRYYFLRLQQFLSYKSFIVKSRLKSCGKFLSVSKKTRLVNLKYVSVGNNCIIDEYAEIYCNRISRDIEPSLTIGNDVHISKHCCIGCSNSITLGDDVRLAPYCHITDRNHVYNDINIPIWKQGSVSPGPVFIGNHTWLGFGVQVMPNVKIGRHCVVAAGSVVTRDIPDYCVAVGMPAKIIKQYNTETKSWEKVK